MATVIRGSDNFDTAIGANVVQTHVTTTSSQSLTSLARVDLTGLTATITPKYVTSRIMVEVRWAGENNGGNENILFGIRRGGVDVGNASVDGSRPVGIAGISQGYFNSDNDSTMDSAMYTFMDSPNTTSATTYTASVINRDASILYNNRTVADNASGAYERLTSSITLTEVQG